MSFVSFVISLSTEILILNKILNIIPATKAIGNTIATIITNNSGRLTRLFPDFDVATNLELLIFENKPLIMLLMLLPLIENILLVAIIFFV